MYPTIHESTISALERALSKCESNMEKDSQLKNDFEFIKNLANGKLPSNKYRLYARFEGEKNYKAVDINSGLMVNSLDDSTILEESECHRFRSFVTEFGEKFPNLEFDIRLVKEKKRKETKQIEKREPLPNNLNDLFDHMVKMFDERSILNMFKEVYSDEIDQMIEEQVNSEIEEKVKEIEQDEQKEGIIKVKVTNLNNRIKLDEFLYNELYPNYSDQLSNLFIA